MLHCDLDLGARPWDRLAEGRVKGTVRWNGGERLPVSVKVRGAHSRRFPRKSLQVDLTREHLPDGPPEGHTVRRVHINADYIDPTLLRSALSYRLFDAVGAPAPVCRHVSLRVSGAPAGLYVALESVDSDFCRRRGLTPGPMYYAVNRNANFALVSASGRTYKQPVDLGYKPVQSADPAPLRRMLTELNLASDRGFPTAAERWLDVDVYFRWLMVAVFVGNRDGFMHNYALYLHPESRRFWIIPWDYDATWGIDIHGRPARLDRVPVAGWNRLSSRLMANPQYRARYRQMFLEALEGPLSPDSVWPLIDKVSGQIAPWLDTDSLRRADKKRFPTAVDALRRWAVDRRALLQEDLSRL